MISIENVIVPLLVAFIATLWIHPRILEIAVMKNIVDNPDARKLQRRPVPVIGGIAVFFGLLIGLCSSQVITTNNIFIYVASMCAMLYLGTIDDILNLTPRLRFAIEIIIVVLLMVVSGDSINNFHGFWGIEALPMWLAYPLTVVASVGIINAINLIDGVNGLSTGFCIMASSLLAVHFYATDNLPMTIIAVSAVGGIIPFFLHNVFGERTRMFIGDGGALVMGILMSIFMMNILSSWSLSSIKSGENFGLIPFCLSILSIPVFDTLRVMSSRMLKGKSPFNADKTHLHHMFIDLGFSHVGTTFSILSINSLIVGIWFLSYLLGASIDLQLYIVVLLSILFTFIMYPFMRKQIRQRGKIFKAVNKVATTTHFENRKFWLALRNFIDKI